MYGFEVIEEEVRVCGKYAVMGGLTTIFLSFIPPRNRVNQLLSFFVLFVLILAQILPILLWIIRAPITDTPNVYMGNRLYVFPHIFIVIFSLLTIREIRRSSSNRYLSKR